MKHGFLRTAHVVALSFIALTACGGPRYAVNPYPVVIDGYEHAFPFPRSDVPAGSVVAIWKDGSVSPVCILGLDFGSVQSLYRNPELKYRELSETSFKTDLSLRVEQVLKAALGAHLVKNVDLDMRVVAITYPNPLNAAQQATASEACKSNVAFIKKHRPRSLKYLSVIAAEAEYEIVYRVTLSPDFKVDAGLEKTLVDKLGFTPSVSASMDGKSTILISGQKLIGQFKAEDSYVDL